MHHMASEVAIDFASRSVQRYMAAANFMTTAVRKSARFMSVEPPMLPTIEGVMMPVVKTLVLAGRVPPG